MAELAVLCQLPPAQPTSAFKGPLKRRQETARPSRASMAEDMDPATAALLRAMHREMNGLTRGRSRLTSTEPKIKRQRLNESQSSTSEESRRAVDADHSSKNGLTRPQAASAGASRPLRRLQKQPSAAAAAQEASRKPHGMPSHRKYRTAK